MATTIDSAYPLPPATTEGEAHRLNLQHEIVTTMLGGISSAALPQKVRYAADLACGTGIWTREFASLHPEAQVMGVDLEPPSPLPSDPKNVQFLTANLEGDWDFVAQPFDYIWTRFLVAAIKSWSQFFERISQNLAPGGRFEIFEALLGANADDASANAENSAFIRLLTTVSDQLRKKGVDLDVISRFGDMIQAAGLELETQQAVPVYLDDETAMNKDSRQTQEVAQKMREDLALALPRMVETLFNETSSPTLIEAKLLLEEVREDIRLNAKSRGYHLSHISLVARKPQE